MSRALTQEEISTFRTTLCEIATRRFAELGYEGVTMRALASEVGCSPMTPYRYFSGKDEIFAVVRAAAYKRLADTCEAAYESVGDEILRALAISEAYLQFALDEPDAYRIMFELSQPAVDDYPELAEQVDRCQRYLERPTWILVEAGVLEGDPEKLSQVFWAGIHGVIVLHLTGRLDPGTDVRELYRLMTRTLGLGAQGPNYQQLRKALQEHRR